MLDLFGNVFGRSKKSASGSNQASTSKQESGSTDGDTDSTQENPPANTLYPYIDFSELSKNGETIGATASSSALITATSSTNIARQMDDHHLSLLNNVPFTCNTNLSGQKMSVELKPYFDAIDKIEVFLSAPSMSDYNFSLEKSFLAEYQ